MTDRPILFSGPMVRALLDGRKTQTRRIAPIQPPPECGINFMLGNESWLPSERRKPVRRTFEAWHGDLFRNKPAAALCGSFEIVPRIQPGDRLWVREAWRTLQKWDCLAPRQLAEDSWNVTFEADPESRNPTWAFGKLRPSMFMPRWASRLTLIVSDVRVERLQDISEADARAEGVLWVPGHGEITPVDLPEGYSNYLNCREGYQVLWDSLNAKRGFGWDTNPWCCAITFEVHRANIDALAEQVAA